MSQTVCEHCGSHPVKPVAVRSWWMHDNHTFTLLDANPRRAIRQAKDLARRPGGDGMLCPVIVLGVGDTEVCRVGTPVHGGRRVPPETFDRRADAWLEAVLADPHVRQVLEATPEGGEG